MLPYFLLIFVSGLFPLVVYQSPNAVSRLENSERTRKKNKLTLRIFFIGLFLLLALRDITVGKDLKEYKNIFEMCQNQSFRDLHRLDWELGYTSFNKLIGFISQEYRIFLVITALITLIPIYKLYVQEEKYSFLLIVLFINMPCFLMMFSGLRQTMAISIGIVAYVLLTQKKYIFSVLCVVLAAYFHISAFVLLLIYPAYFLKIKTKHLLYIVPVMLVIYLFRIPILTFLIGFMPSQYIYFYGEVQETGAIGMMILFLIFFVFAFVILDEKAMSKQDYFMRNVLLIATIFQLFVPIHGLIQRASYYFLIFVPVSIVRIVQAPKRYLKSITLVAVIVMVYFFTLYFFYTAYFSTDNLLGVFPYKFFWSGQ